MENIGLKKHSKYINKSLPLGEAFINVCPFQTNVIFNIPLVEKLGISYIFNYLAKNEMGTMGKGAHISLFKKINNNSFTNPDFTVDNYTFDVKNKETGYTLSRKNESNNQTYELVDGNGSTIVYNSSTANYPTKIIDAQGKELLFSTRNNTMTVECGEDKAEILLEGKGRISNIVVTTRYTTVQTISFVYRYDMLERIDFVSPRGGCSSLCIEWGEEYGNEFVEVVNATNNNGTRFVFENSKIYDVEDVVNNHVKQDLHFTFDDSTKLAMVGESDGTIKYYLFEKRFIQNKNYYFLTLCADTEGKVTSSYTNDDFQTEYSFSYDKVLNDAAIIKNASIDSFGAVGQSYNANVVERLFVFDTAKSVSNLDVTKTLDVHGNGSDVFILSCLVKSSSTSPVTITGRLNGASSSIKVDNTWKMLCVKFETSSSFDTLTATLKANGNIIIGAINVFKNSFANFYTYDQEGNNTGNGDIAYQNGAVSGVVGGNGARYYMEYDDNNDLVKFKAPNGVTVTCSYQDHKLTGQNIDSIGHHIHYYKEYDGDNLVFEGGDQPVHRYEYDEFGSVKKIYDTFWRYVECDYNEFGDLTSIIGKVSSYDENNFVDVSYGYDAQRRLTTVSISNGSCYQFSYDTLSRIESVSLNGDIITRYEYNEYGDVEKQYVGNDYFEFEYNDKRDVSRVTLPSSSLSFQYYYDQYGRLIEIEKNKNGTTSVVESYTYDNQGRIVSTRNGTKEIIRLFEGRQETRVKSIFNNKEIVQEFDTVDRSRGSNPETIISEILNNQDYNVAPLINDYHCVGRKSTYPCCSRPNNTIMSGEPMRDGVIPYLSTSSRPVYIVTGDSLPHTNETIAFWFKTSEHKSNACLFFVGNNAQSGNKGSLAIYEKNGNHFEVIVTDYAGNEQVIISTETSSHYQTNKWNFISLAYYSRDDGPGYGFDGECVLRLNNKVYRKVLAGYSEYCDLTGRMLEMNIGYKYDFFSQVDKQSQRIVDEFKNCKITLVMIANRRFIGDSKMYEYYRKTKDYIVDNSLLDTYDFYAADCSITRIIKDQNTSFDSFKVFPLENNVLSLDYDPTAICEDDIPYQFDIRKGSESDKDRTFNFNKDAKKYAFVADGNKLTYKASLGQSGTFAANFYADETNDIQYLFDIKSPTVRISLYRNKNKQLELKFNGSERTSNLVMSSSQWHQVAISSDTYMQSDSNTSYKVRFFRVVCDGNTDTFTFTTEANLNNIEIMLGRSFDEVTTGNSWDSIKTSYALFGQISNFAYSKAYCAESTIMGFFNNLKNFSKVSFYDELGFLSQEEIRKEGNQTPIYTRERNQYSQFIVNYEVFKTNGQTIQREYGYDRAGFLIYVTDYTPDYRQIYYQYDDRGFLCAEHIHDSVVKYYLYDGNGNITQRTTEKYSNGGIQQTIVDTFAYDVNNPDKLIAFNNENITYSASTPGNIATFGSWTFTYSCGRLVKASRPTTYMTIQNGRHVESRGTEIVEFEYDSQGRRTSKTVTIRAIGFSMTGGMNRIIETHTVTYEYDGKNLVYEKSEDREMFYLYDENKELYGYILNGNKYFLMKDAYENVLGLIDENGSIVAQYTYDAYGNLINKTGTVYNPIRYKGYYYDSELEMFYCMNRYYVPKICRWLTADDPNYIEEADYNKLNLFAYCANNPVVCIDRDGHSLTVLGICAIVGLIIGACTGFGVAVYVDYKNDGEVFNGDVPWYDYLGATLVGGAAGALLGAAIGYILPPAITIAVPTIGFTVGASGTATLCVVAVPVAISTTAVGVVATALGTLAAGIMFAKGFGPRMGHNQHENKQIDDLCKKHHLTKDERRRLHEEISHQNYTYEQIEELIWELFHK